MNLHGRRAGRTVRGGLLFGRALQEIGLIVFAHRSLRGQLCQTGKNGVFKVG
jgi:hypothetical protein